MDNIQNAGTQAAKVQGIGLGSAMDYRNGLDVQSDMAAGQGSVGVGNTPFMGGANGLLPGRGGYGLGISAGAVQLWSDEIDGGIALRNMPRDPRTYTVQSGDNPATIGRNFFGDERAGAAILAANSLSSSVRGARSLPVGQVLTIPDDISAANLRAGGSLIGADTSIRRQEAAAASTTAAAADRQRWDSLQVGAWNGRTSLPAAQAAAGTTAGNEFVAPYVRIPVNVTADSGIVTAIPANVTEGRCCAL